VFSEGRDRERFDGTPTGRRVRRAYVQIKETPHYRRDAFCAGLKANAFHLENRLPSTPPAPGDVLVIWNRYSDKELTADLWERQGGTVLVAENGYIGRDAAGHQLYAISVHGHNGSGTWPAGDGARWAGLGVELQAWREGGEHILMCPNRHFGMKGLAMPVDWGARTLKALRALTKRTIRVRPHPDGNPPERSLAEDLANCHAMVIWASSAGVHALVAGVPVFCTSPWWILKAAASDRLQDIEQPMRGERQAAFERLAYAQWTVEEIALGVPFAHLLASDAG